MKKVDFDDFFGVLLWNPLLSPGVCKSSLPKFVTDKSDILSVKVNTQKSDILSKPKIKKKNLKIKKIFGVYHFIKLVHMFHEEDHLWQ